MLQGKSWRSFGGFEDRAACQPKLKQVIELKDFFCQKKNDT